MSTRSGWLALLFATAPMSASAADTASGFYFTHHDWEIACDNTRTCRAAGYQADQQPLAVSVLLTRAAGPGEKLTGSVTLGSMYEQEEVLTALPDPFDLALVIDGRRIGAVQVNGRSPVAELTPKLVSALLAALPRSSEIEWVSGTTRWVLSDLGASAVLLKMDEFQGRLETPGALIRRGKRDEGSVLPPLPAPVVIAAPVSGELSAEEADELASSDELRAALRAVVSDDGWCPDLTDPQDGEQQDLYVSRLSDAKLLVSMRCWSAAYNVGAGHWVINDSQPWEPVLVTTAGSEDEAEGSISSSHKGRGIGDCWSSDSWVWDGARFVHTEDSTSGMCKLVALGGAWSLPTLVTEVRSK